MPKATSKVKKTIEPVVEVMNFSTGSVQFEQPIQPLGLNLEVGRQDLNENFRLIQEKINELIK